MSHDVLPAFLFSTFSASLRLILDRNLPLKITDEFQTKSVLPSLLRNCTIAKVFLNAASLVYHEETLPFAFHSYLHQPQHSGVLILV